MCKEGRQYPCYKAAPYLYKCNLDAGDCGSSKEALQECYEKKENWRENSDRRTVGEPHQNGDKSQHLLDCDPLGHAVLKRVGWRRADTGSCSAAWQDGNQLDPVEGSIFFSR